MSTCMTSGCENALTTEGAEFLDCFGGSCLLRLRLLWGRASEFRGMVGQEVARTCSGENRVRIVVEGGTLKETASQLSV